MVETQMQRHLWYDLEDNLLLDDTELVQDLEVTLVAGFVADITVIDLCQRGDEEKWCECESKLEWKA